MDQATLLLALLLPSLSALAADRIEPGREGALEIPGCDHPCRLWVPTDHGRGRRLPLILFLHGAGGKPTTWPWRSATGGKGYLVVGLSYGPLPGGGRGRSGIRSDPASRRAMVAFIDRVRARVEKEYGSDPERVFLSGLSMGGWGVNFYGFLPAAAGRYRGYCIMAAGLAPSPEPDLTVTRGLPVLLINGETDPNRRTADRGRPLLEAAGARVTQVVIPGQGHVPATETLAPPLGKWLAGIAARDARERALAAVAWREAELAGRQRRRGRREEALLDFLRGQALRRRVEGERPLLLWCTVGGEGRAAPRCRKVAAETFAHPAACRTPAAARHFACFRVALDGLPREEHPLLSRRDAPLVILVDRKWERLTLLAGGAIRDRALARAMEKLLTPRERERVADRVAETAPVLREMQRLERRLDRARRALDRRGGSRLAGKVEELERRCGELREKLARPGKDD